MPGAGMARMAAEGEPAEAEEAQQELPAGRVLAWLAACLVVRDATARVPLGAGGGSIGPALAWSGRGWRLRLALLRAESRLAFKCPAGGQATGTRR